MPTDNSSFYLMNNLPFIVCIPAAGEGKRMHAPEPKQFLELLGIPILMHTLRIFDSMPECEKIIIATNDETKILDLKKKYQSKKDIFCVKGGGTRQQSVMNCLEDIQSDSIVLVHDAVRPCVTHEEIREVVRAIHMYGAALLAAPARDTIKRIDQSMMIAETIPRQKIFLAQTPQGSKAHILKRAYQVSLEKNISVTDDVQVLEQQGIPVKVVAGKVTNIKITDPDDLIIAEAILRNRMMHELK